MADAKKFKIGGIWYNVKDETARNELSGKQDTLTFDSAPTASSTNPVTSGGGEDRSGCQAGHADV